MITAAGPDPQAIRAARGQRRPAGETGQLFVSFGGDAVVGQRGPRE
jgi:hypothetical protein